MEAKSASSPKCTWLNVAVRVCARLPVCARKNTYRQEEGPLGMCPFAVILIQLSTSCSSAPSSPLTLFLAPPERRINNALPQTPSGFSLSFYSSPLLLLQLVTLEKTECCFASHGEKYNGKGQQTRDHLNTTIFVFISIYQSMHFFDQAGKNCTNNINILFSWQWHELFNQWYCQ